MSDIKSAREIAEEKLAKLGEATAEERLRWKFAPKGTELAANYLKDDSNLLVELGQYGEEERHYVVTAASEVLARNIDLPRNDGIRRTNKRMMDGIKLLKQDKTTVENVFSRMRQIFNHYNEQGEQQRQQAYDQLKAQFEQKVQQAVQQQMGSAAMMRVDVERQPQFQEEWRRVRGQLETSYLQYLDEFRRELVAIP
jgi:hypothetical protein